MKVTVELSDLTTKEVQTAIESGDENQLRDLLLAKYEEAKSKGLSMDGFYYAPYVACSDETFDMFSFKSIETLFGLHGYTVNLEFGDEAEEIGMVVVSKVDFTFQMTAVVTMHDSLYATFVDTKTAKMIPVS